MAVDPCPSDVAADCGNTVAGRDESSVNDILTPDRKSDASSLKCGFDEEFRRHLPAFDLMPLCDHIVSQQCRQKGGTYQLRYQAFAA
jgi:hypothetical protein